jgi:predicted nucleic acid-binding protein
MDIQSARDDVRSLFAWHPIPVDADVVQGAWSMHDRFTLSWLDSLIVSPAQVGDCRYLLTEDLRENLAFGDVRVINPFLRSPESLNLQSKQSYLDLILKDVLCRC